MDGQSTDRAPVRRWVPATAVTLLIMSAAIAAAVAVPSSTTRFSGALTADQSACAALTRFISASLGGSHALHERKIVPNESGMRMAAAQIGHFGALSRSPAIRLDARRFEAAYRLHNQFEYTWISGHMMQAYVNANGFPSSSIVQVGAIVRATSPPLQVLVSGHSATAGAVAACQRYLDYLYGQPPPHYHPPTVRPPARAHFLSAVRSFRAKSGLSRYVNACFALHLNP
jgi:hypothetical protein